MGTTGLTEYELSLPHEYTCKMIGLKHLSLHEEGQDFTLLLFL